MCLGGDFARQIIQAGAVVTGGPPPPTAAGADAAAATLDAVVQDLSGPEDYPNLIREFARRGYTPAQIRAICWENLLRVVGHALA